MTRLPPNDPRNAFRRPVPQQGYQPAPGAAYQSPYEEQPYQPPMAAPYSDAPDGAASYADAPYAEVPYEEAPYEEAPYTDEPYGNVPYEEDATDRRTPYHEPVAQEIIATNSTVRLTCTLSAMMGLFALFLCFAEKKSRAIRHFSVQSTGLSCFHLVLGLALLLIGSLLGMIPILGFLIQLVCWLIYIAVLIVTVFLRVKMMFAAWRGVKFTLPLIGHRLEHFC